MANFLTNVFYKKRTDFNAQTKERVLPFPDGIIEETDLIYSQNQPESHRFDIFTPQKTKDEPLPVIINVHGGGMIMGNKEFNRYFCAQMCKMNFLIFNIEYRLVPDIQVYDQFADITAAMNHIETLIPQYHGDKNHVYIVADSGGAYLTTYTVAMQKCSALAKAANIVPSTLKIQALGLISGMFYTTKLDEIGLTMPKYLYGKKYKKSAFAPFINPEHPNIVTSLPPCYLITSEHDNLKHYTLNFEKALTRHHVTHELKYYPKNKKLTHAFSVFEPYMPESIDAISSMLEFLRKY